MFALHHHRVVGYGHRAGLGRKVVHIVAAAVVRIVVVVVVRKVVAVEAVPTGLAVRMAAAASVLVLAIEGTVNEVAVLEAAAVVCYSLPGPVDMVTMLRSFRVD